MSADDNGSPEREPVVDLRDGFGTLAGAVRQVVGHLRLMGVYDPHPGPVERAADVAGQPALGDSPDGGE